MFKWNPWAELEAAQERLDRLWRGPCAQAGDPALWTPTADLLETPAAYLLRVELPGLALEAVRLELAGSQLRISGQRPPERDCPGAVYHALERPQGPFARAFTLPADARPEAVTASLKDGLLTVTIPRRTEEPCGPSPE